MSVCEKCGAEYSRPCYIYGEHSKNPYYVEWKCGSFVDTQGFKESPACLRNQLTQCQAELKLWKPLTPKEAEAAFDAAVAVPISDDKIRAMVERITDPTYRPTEPEHVLMAAKITQLEAALAATTAERDELKRTLSLGVEATQELAQKYIELKRELENQGAPHATT